MKEILEIVGIVVALIISIMAAIKYWDAAKSAKEFSSDLGKVYGRLREVENKVQKTVADCQSSHASFNTEVLGHLKDSKIHRDSELETFRYDTLAKAIGEIKTDLTKSVEKVEAALCTRMDTLEKTVRNGTNGAKS